MVESLWWLDHQKPEDRPDPRSSMSKSYSNSFEVDMTIGMVQYLVDTNEYDFNDIAILTPYNGQLALLTQKLSGTCSVWLSEKDRENLLDEGLLTEEEAKFGKKADVGMSSMLRLATIDNFQGEEAKVVILSTVRSNPDDHVGFLKTSNRINVACSRARNGFYIIGNASLMRGVKMWGKIVRLLTERAKIGGQFQTQCPRHPEKIYTIGNPEEFKQIPACQVPCGSQLPCGHSCKEKCHAPSLHNRMACSQPCNRVHESCGHQCTRSCGESCGECLYELSPAELPCGHVHKSTCAENQNSENTVCTVAVGSILLECGHHQERLCSSKDLQSICQAKCKRSLDCGHLCPGKCLDCQAASNHAACLEACGKGQSCGHSCAARCHTGKCPPCQLPCKKSCEHGSCSRGCNSICDPCVKLCSWKCQHMAACSTMCSLPCGQIPCSEPCDRILTCGHVCPGMCGERCADKCIQCITGSVPGKLQLFLTCGHYFDLETIDTYVGLGNVYDIDSRGVINRVLLNPSAIQASGANPCCPDCGAECVDTRRYAIFKQLRELPDTVDRLYAKMGRKMNIFMNWIIRSKEDLDTSFETFSKKMRPGPLTGKTNERWVRDRGNAMMEVQRKIVNFRGTHLPYSVSSKETKMLQMTLSLKLKMTPLTWQTFLVIPRYWHHQILRSRFGMTLFSSDVDSLLWRSRSGCVNYWKNSGKPLNI